MFRIKIFVYLNFYNMEYISFNLILFHRKLNASTTYSTLQINWDKVNKILILSIFLLFLKKCYTDCSSYLVI